MDKQERQNFINYKLEIKDYVKARKRAQEIIAEHEKSQENNNANNREVSWKSAYKNDLEEYVHAKESGLYDWDPEGFEESICYIPQDMKETFFNKHPAYAP